MCENLIRSNKDIQVAYCGVEGAFAYIAAGRIFQDGNRVSYNDFKAAYDSVLNGECDVAVLPIENSYAGEVDQTIDLIYFGKLYINEIYELEIHQNLLGLVDATINDIRLVASHSQAISQCYEYVKEHGFELREESNTAVAAKMVAEKNDKSFGAIASAETAELYGLKVIEANINESNDNTTRFAVMSKSKPSCEANSSAVLMFAVKDEVGSLARAINIISNYGFNMTSLRSRPIRKQSWHYYSYVEIDSNSENQNFNIMLEELAKVCDELKVAGTFEPHKII